MTVNAYVINAERAREWSGYSDAVDDIVIEMARSGRTPWSRDQR